VSLASSTPMGQALSQRADGLSSSYCQQAVFVGTGDNCDLASGTVVPAYAISGLHGGGRTCTQ